MFWPATATRAEHLHICGMARRSALCLEQRRKGVSRVRQIACIVETASCIAEGRAFFPRVAHAVLQAVMIHYSCVELCKDSQINSD